MRSYERVELLKILLIWFSLILLISFFASKMFRKWVSQIRILLSVILICLFLPAQLSLQIKAWYKDIVSYSFVAAFAMLFLYKIFNVSCKKIKSFEFALLIASLIFLVSPLYSILNNIINPPNPQNYLREDYNSIENIRISRKDNLPDIYYIILDMYGRSDYLSAKLGYDNKWFVKELEGMGFYVPKYSTSNYKHTHLTIPTVFNINYQSELFKTGIENNRSPFVYQKAFDDNRVNKIVKEVGYQTVHHNTWWNITHSNANADHGVVHYNYSLAWRALVMSTALSKVDNITPLGGYTGGHKSYMKSKLLGLRNNMSAGNVTTNPKFHFIHLICPHDPYIYNKDGSMVTALDELKRRFLKETSGKHKLEDSYIAQLEFLNKTILDILKNKKKGYDPIIYFQADHGTHFTPYSKSPKESIREEHCIFSAYYFPSNYRSKVELYPTITPINAMRLLLSAVSGVEIDKVEDKNYHFVKHEDEFRDVTDLVKNFQFKKLGDN